MSHASKPPAAERNQKKADKVCMLVKGAYLDVWPNALDHVPNTAAALDSLRELLALKEQATFKMGKLICKMRRKQAFYSTSDSVSSYRFSRTVFRAEAEVPTLVQDCIDFMNTTYKTDRFNAALAILYTDGHDYISAHSDDEPAHSAGDPIGTFSFGPGQRKMVFKVKKGEKAADANVCKCECEMVPGSCVVMRGPLFQQALTHEIPRQLKVKDWRVSITVRQFHADADVDAPKRPRKTTPKKKHPTKKLRQE